MKYWILFLFVGFIHGLWAQESSCDTFYLETKTTFHFLETYGSVDVKPGYYCLDRRSGDVAWITIDGQAAYADLKQFREESANLDRRTNIGVLTLDDFKYVYFKNNVKRKIAPGVYDVKKEYDGTIYIWVDEELGRLSTGYSFYENIDFVKGYTVSVPPNVYDKPSRPLHVESRGRVYYINKHGNKTYVTRSRGKNN